MRFVRRASVLFSLTLIVAIAVGYVARTAELSRDRDRELTTVAEIGAARLGALVDSVEVAARSATSTESTAEALTAAYPGLGVCVADADGSNCNQATSMPAEADVRAATRRWVDGDAEMRRAPTVSEYDSRLTIEADGPVATVLVGAGVDVLKRSDLAQTLAVTTVLPSENVVGRFTTAQGVRQTVASVATFDERPLTDVYVVATVSTAVSLEVAELRFYIVIFSLGVVLMGLAGVTMFVEQRNLQERASFDPLTKLPNRGEFERRADHIVTDDRSDEGACLLLFDLNGFKQVNDTYGHLAGDELLKVVGKRLKTAVRDQDVVARWGGDEFVVVMPGIDTEDMASRRALELAEQIGGRTRIPGVSAALRVKVSVGVALWPLHGEQLPELVVAADQAMYEAKRAGVTYRIVEPPAEPEGNLAGATVEDGGRQEPGRRRGLSTLAR